MADTRATLSNDLTLKIGEKGGVSVYGLGRFPVTLYFEQWVKLIEVISEVDDFLVQADEAKLLKRKGDNR